MRGLGREATVFYEHVRPLAYDGSEPSAEEDESLERLVVRIVAILRGTIDVLDFWRKPTEVKRLRAGIDTEILLAGVAALEARHERIAVEIVKLAEKRHGELLE